MKRTLTRILALLILSLLPAALGGCSLFSLDHFTLHQANIVDFKLTEGATVRMTIENRSLFKVTVTGGELTAYYRGQPIGDIYLDNTVELPRRATTTANVKVGLRFRSTAAALSALSALRSDPDQITISGYGEGRVWWFTKRFERTDVPLSKFIAIFGDVSNYL